MFGKSWYGRLAVRWQQFLIIVAASRAAGLRLRHMIAPRSNMAFMFNFSFPELSDLTEGNVFHGAAPSTAAAAQPEEERKASESTTGSRSDVYDLTQSGTVEDKKLLPFKEHRVFRQTDETTASDEVKLDTALLLSATVIPETEWNTLAVGDITLQFVSPEWLDRKLYNLPEAEVTSEGATASDIVPNVYEGGFRVWDGACDMLSFLVTSDHVILKDKKVLEAVVQVYQESSLYCKAPMCTSMITTQK
ncbi:hypothetical protein RvY_10356-2 [Ramazzottius varieornatus]|uniref:Uncharacterized protein n=1 Tax=Ramazzottius varieornatus TaxID=947166 RepID=A0A1D1VHU9_RAMVA|nr:hypothetical protein RvY_10356-2 [Ramazzottius varieornatus]